MFIFLILGILLGCYVYTFNGDFNDEDKGIITLTAVVLLAIGFILSII